MRGSDGQLELYRQTLAKACASQGSRLCWVAWTFQTSRYLFQHLISRRRCRLSLRLLTRLFHRLRRPITQPLPPVTVLQRGSTLNNCIPVSRYKHRHPTALHRLLYPPLNDAARSPSQENRTRKQDKASTQPLARVPRIGAGLSPTRTFGSERRNLVHPGVRLRRKAESDPALRSTALWLRRGGIVDDKSVSAFLIRRALALHLRAVDRLGSCS